MLTVKFLSVSEVAPIYNTLRVDGEPFGSNFVMYDETTPVALMRLTLKAEGGETVGVIENIVFADGVEEGDKTFFLHAMFFKFREGAPLRLRIPGERKEFEKFGFEFINGNMEINSNDINLYYNCTRHKKQG